MLLQVNQVSKWYGKAIGLQNVSFEVKKGEIIGIVGESGSGKSTLLRLIAGLDDTTTGEIYFEGQQIEGRSQRLIAGHKAIKLVQQDFQLMPRHKIAENIGYYLRHLPNPQYDQAIANYLTRFELEACANKLPAELSGGQQQRTALAVALAASPELLLLDEPFSHLDMRLKHSIKQSLLAELQENAITAIIVTHDIYDALALTNRIVIMQEGQVVRIDTAKNIYQNPENEYVARLFGNTNILPVQLFTHLFSSQVLALLPTSKVCVRAENWIIHTAFVENSFAVEVEQQHFMGFYYELIGKMRGYEGKITVIAQQYITESLIYLTVDFNNILPLK
jgi:iron(III) transport system ATP-binding protein